MRRLENSGSRGQISLLDGLLLASVYPSTSNLVSVYRVLRGSNSNSFRFISLTPHHGVFVTEAGTTLRAEEEEWSSSVKWTKTHLHQCTFRSLMKAGLETSTRRPTPLQDPKCGTPVTAGTPNTGREDAEAGEFPHGRRRCRSKKSVAVTGARALCHASAT